MDNSKKADITIGIGLTTTPNRKHLADEWLINFRKHTKEPYHLHIHEDINYRGVAYSKNENLKALKDCDYIFLFDDDCYPIDDDWVNFFTSSNEKHLLFLTDKHTLIYNKNGTGYYRDCGGVFMMLTKEIISKVGAFGNYGQYGFEHAGYSHRIYKAGFTNAPYQMLKGTSNYLKALDYSGQILSSVSDEVKQREIDKNRMKFIEEVNNKNYFVNFT
jgi:hypothetical protein